MTRPCKVCKKQFIARHDTKKVAQVVCSCKCAAAYYEGPRPKGKVKVRARQIAHMVGRRSMAEVRFDRDHIEGKPFEAGYETCKLRYLVKETRSYTPDWKIFRKGSNRMPLYIEYKGILDGRSRKLLKLVKEQYTGLDLRIVFENANNKIYRGSKTTYGMWADQHGFICADNTLPKEWLK